MTYNAEKRKKKEATKPILNTGIWMYSRHPNYVGELMWWWSLGLFSVLLGEAWALAGTGFNTLVLAGVTVMTEQRMLKNWPSSRADLYRQYQRDTAVWIPVPLIYPWGFGFRSRPPTEHEADSYEKLNAH